MMKVAQSIRMRGSRKVWNVWAEKQEPETCVQTLVGHGATVTAILERAGGIVSCSIV